MKHEKEWYTCDRCGEEIKIPPKGISKRKVSMTVDEYEIITQDESGYIAGTEIESPGVLSVEIVKYYDEKSKTIQLCRKCRKAFERFMRNEDNG